MNYTKLNLGPNSKYTASVTVDKSSEVGKMTALPGGAVISWKITFHTDSQCKIIDVKDTFMGDIIHLEEYDFKENSIELLQ
jgi:hypothetical protein